MLQINQLNKRRAADLLFKLRPRATLVFLAGCVLGFIAYPTFYTPAESPLREKPAIPVCFSPEGQCTSHITAAIDSAQASILVMAYSFTSTQIANALINAHERGVDVRVLIDKSQLRAKSSQCFALVQKGIPVLIDPAVGIAHNKTMIFDGRYVLTGSFNFTRSAESRNAENVLLIDDTALAQIYRKNWDQRAARAKKVTAVQQPSK